MDLQFPIIPAEAITIHKSQGSTYNSIAVHIDNGLTRALTYVAFSRTNTCYANSLLQIILNQKQITNICSTAYQNNALLELILSYNNSNNHSNLSSIQFKNSIDIRYKSTAQQDVQEFFTATCNKFPDTIKSCFNLFRQIGNVLI